GGSNCTSFRATGRVGTSRRRPRIGSCTVVGLASGVSTTGGLFASRLGCGRIGAGTVSDDFGSDPDLACAVGVARIRGGRSGRAGRISCDATRVGAGGVTATGLASGVVPIGALFASRPGCGTNGAGTVSFGVGSDPDLGCDVGVAVIRGGRLGMTGT